MGHALLERRAAKLRRSAQLPTISTKGIAVATGVAAIAGLGVGVTSAVATEESGTPCIDYLLSHGTGCIHSVNHKYYWIEGLDKAGAAICAGLAGAPTSKQNCVGSTSGGYGFVSCVSNCQSSRDWYSFVHNHSDTRSDHYSLYVSYT